MAFLKRLGYYMIGLTIGIIFLTLFLKKKTSETGTEFCYFPNCRVLKELRSKPLSYSSQIQEMINAREIDTLEIQNVLRDGDVIFSESDTEAQPCKTFLVEGNINKNEAALLFKNCDSLTILESIDLKLN
ncbi:MAG: DUF4258 domain-containing protein [Muriicola sp.]|nr:DUF4258 domain-containing protein [Muriicola sp.]NNK10969.1 DUF4258 domain-containing protein [Flavobacteriaceae bacterium]